MISNFFGGIGFALLCWFGATAYVWVKWIVTAFHLQEPYGRDLWQAFLVAFVAPNLRPITIGSMLAGVAVAYLAHKIAYIFIDPNPRKADQIRGVQLRPVSILRRMTNGNTLRNRFIRLGTKMKYAPKWLTPWQIIKELVIPIKQTSLADVPFPVDNEPLHCLIAGSTGSGKSQAIRELLKKAQARGDRFIIVDPNGDYYAMFGQKDDVILNPFDARDPGWSIFNEIREPYDCDRFARSVIPDGSGNDKEWNGYAQTLFKELLRKLYREGCRDTNVLTTFLCELPERDLGTYMSDTPVSGFFAEDAGKVLSSTRFIATRYVSPHKHLHPGDFSLRDWLAGKQSNLYITWRQDMADALRPLISTWFDILTTTTLSLPVENDPRPVWFVCDELASLERLSSLEDGLTKGRKHGARYLCGIQSTAQLDDIYGKDKAITLRSCFRNTMYLNIPVTDSQTAEELSKGIGEAQFRRKDLSRNFKLISFEAGQRTIANREVQERLVLPSQIQSLPNLEGYLAYAGAYPVSYIKIKPRKYPKINKAFIQRVTPPPPPYQPPPPPADVASPSASQEAVDGDFPPETLALPAGFDGGQQQMAGDQGLPQEEWQDSDNFLDSDYPPQDPLALPEDQEEKPEHIAAPPFGDPMYPPSLEEPVPGQALGQQEDEEEHEEEDEETWLPPEPLPQEMPPADSDAAAVEDEPKPKG